MAQSQDLIKKSIIWRVGKGITVKAYSDCWILRLETWRIYLSGSNETISFFWIYPHKSWNEVEVRAKFPSFEPEAILDIPLQRHLSEDIWFWKWDKKGWRHGRNLLWDNSDLMWIQLFRSSVVSSVWEQWSATTMELSVLLQLGEFTIMVHGLPQNLHTFIVVYCWAAENYSNVRVFLDSTIVVQELTSQTKMLNHQGYYFQTYWNNLNLVDLRILVLYVGVQKIVAHNLGQFALSHLSVSCWVDSLYLSGGWM